MDPQDLPKMDDADRFSSLFIQDDEPLENLRPKKTNPFEECSSSDSEREAPPPKPRLRIRVGKPPLIITRPPYGNQYKPPAPPPAAPPLSPRAERRAADIHRASDVLNAARRRQTPSRAQRPSTKPPTPLTPASVATTERGDCDVPAADTVRGRQISGALAQTRGFAVSGRMHPQTPRRPQQSRDTPARSHRQPRVVSGEGMGDVDGGMRDCEVREAGGTFFDFSEGGDG
ncbi:hypothetical protein LTR08_006686 [Meristemomyces frigidus]|nr:hypothetical protein LTR08_006686 [Meristemomyces frigidus]